jgi:hypothetical protein
MTRRPFSQILDEKFEARNAGLAVKPPVADRDA